MGSRPSMMQAVELPAFDSPLRLVERPIPEPGPGQVRIRVQACGVCGSDLFLQKGGFGNQDVLPVIPGHVAAGVVDALGAGVTDWAVGEQAALYYITAPSGDAFAAAGRPNISPQLSRMGVDIDGAFAEYMIRPTTALIRPREPVDPRVLPRETWDIFDASVIRGLQSGSLMPIFEDLLEVRRFIEVETAALAALRAGPDNIQRLEATIESMEAAIADPAEYFRQDVEFHSQLLHAAHNRVLERLIEPVRDLLMTAKQQVISVSSEQSLRESLEGHRRIARAVCRHDAETAREAMRAHLVLAETDLKHAATQIDEEGEWGTESRVSMAGM